MSKKFFPFKSNASLFHVYDLLLPFFFLRSWPAIIKDVCVGGLVFFSFSLSLSFFDIPVEFVCATTAARRCSRTQIIVSPLATDRKWPECDLYQFFSPFFLAIRSIERPAEMTEQLFSIDWNTTNFLLSPNPKEESQEIVHDFSFCRYKITKFPLHRFDLMFVCESINEGHLSIFTTITLPSLDCGFSYRFG